MRAAGEAGQPGRLRHRGSTAGARRPRPRVGVPLRVPDARDGHDLGDDRRAGHGDGGGGRGGHPRQRRRGVARPVRSGPPVSSPRTRPCDGRARPPTAETGPLLQVQDLRKTFRTPTLPFVGRDTTVRAVDGVSFDVAAGEAFGLVGESGSGKTTIGRLIVRLHRPDAAATSCSAAATSPSSAARTCSRTGARVQMVFQNPYASLNPRRRVRDMIGDAYAIHGIARGRDADAADGARSWRTSACGPNMLDRFPHQFSSGQRQRIGIARALSVDPTLIVADEPVSALDVSVQAQVLNLLRGLQARAGAGRHLHLARPAGRLVPVRADRRPLPGPDDGDRPARAARVEQPIHPYTRALFSSIPSLEPGRGVTRELIRGEISDETPAAGRLRVRAALRAAAAARQPGDLRHGTAAAQRGRAGPRRGVPFRGPGRRRDRRPRAGAMPLTTPR